MTCKFIDAVGFRALAASVLAFAAVPMAGAVEMVAPGETLEFTEAEGGVKQCRISEVIIHFACGHLLTVWYSSLPVPIFDLDLDPDLDLEFIYTGFNESENEVQAAYSSARSPIPVQLGFPHYATGAVYNEFEIEDLHGTKNTVQVQFEIKSSWEGGIAGGGNYDGRITLSVEVEDITELRLGGGPPIGIGSFDLASRDRQGDQGITDIAVGGTAYDRNDDTAAFSLILRSGGMYRVWFKAEAYGAPLGATAVESSIRGRWSELNITVVEDETELLTQIKIDLAQHDTDIKSDIADHDMDIKGDIATHDGDIKALLAGLGDDLAEIKRLLNTPTGRRPDFPIKE